MIKATIFVQMWGKNHRFGQKLNDFRLNVGQNTHFWTKPQNINNHLLIPHS